MKILRWGLFAIGLLFGVFILTHIFGYGSGLVASSVLWILAALACWVLVFFLPRITLRVRTRSLLIAGLANLLVLLVPTALLIELNINLGLPETTSATNLLALLLFLAPCCALVIAPLLLQAGIQPGRSEREASTCLGLAALLLAKTLHNYYWLLVWDGTDDSLDLLWMIIPVYISMIAAFSLFASLDGRARWVGLYALFIPVLLLAVAGNGDKIDFRQLTQQRAERIAYKLQVFREQEGYYPSDLRYLKTPRYLLVVPGPVTIFYRQGWCYQSDGRSYRLGAVYRNHWSEPLIYGKVYAEEGPTTLTLSSLCFNELNALRPIFADFVQFGSP